MSKVIALALTANEEMAEDDLMAVDIEHIIQTGTIIQRFTKDPRGQRYAILGNAVDGRQAYVVCRFCYRVYY